MHDVPPVNPDLTTHRNFAIQAEFAPDKPALGWSGRTLSYGALYERSRVIAQAIATRIGEAKDVGQMPVGVLVSDHFERVASYLGVWMAGHFASLIDTGDPLPRIGTLLKALKPACVVTDVSPDLSTSALDPALPIVRLDASIASLPPLGKIDDSVPVEGLALVSYTSGSTGEPKGVAQSHLRTNVDNLTSGAPGDEINPRQRSMTLFPPTSFATVLDTANSIFRGGHHFFYDPGEKDLADFARAIRDDGINRLMVSPTMIRRLFSAVEAGFVFDDMVTVLSVGEPMQVSDAALVASRVPEGTLLLNLYATSESGAVARSLCYTGGKTSLDEAVWLSDKGPIKRISLVDDRGYEVDDGHAGELVVRAETMAQGYWIDGRVQRLDKQPGKSRTQVHRSGDLFTRREDGKFRYLGRRDFAMSIGGHLIHPTEIEEAVLDHPTVREVVVREQQHPSLGPVIVAYLVGDSLDAAGVSKIRSSLALKLPVHLLPFEYLVVPELPRTSGGKVDRNCLPVPGWSDSSGQENGDKGSPPVAATEKRVARIWREVIGDVTIARDSNFFALGGNSLKALDFIRRLDQEAQREVPLPALYAFPVLSDFAAYLDGDVAMAQVFGSTICVQPGGNMTPFFCAHGEVERLATEISDRRPVYRLTVVHGEAPPSVSSLAEQAATHVDDIQALYPDEPPIIGGFSYGAYVALEMARLLEGQGKPPALVVLLDPLWLPGNEDVAKVPDCHSDTLSTAIASAPRMQSLTSNLGRVQRRIARFYRGRQVRRAERGKTGRLTTAALEYRNMQIFGRYASVHEFSAITSPVLFVVPDKTRHDIRRDVGGWARFCHGPFDVLKIRSARLHSDLFDDAALREIAAGIEQAMDND